MKFGTKALHAGIEPDPSTGAIMTPIFQTSTYVQDGPGIHKGFEYARTQNPTRSVLEKNIASLENATFGRCFASGMSATETVIKTLRPGDEVISTGDLYGGSFRLFTQLFEQFGIKFTFVDMRDVKNVEEAISNKTKLLWIETPTNPLLNIIDIEQISTIGHKYGAKVAVDNTFASPYLQNPLDLGADIVMHSVTKYIAGHSDVIMGFLGTNDTAIDEQFGFIQNSSGAVPGPQDCFLVIRGIKTLHLRMQRHCENGEVIANHLRNHPKVDKVFWPGFKDHPNHDIATKQMRGFGGMISFIQKEDTIEKAEKTLGSFKLFSLAESLGGVESLVGHPAGMTHASIPKEKRIVSGLTDSLIRLSVGIEDIDDLIADLDQAIG
ncbi:cystathionine beta-lyase [Ekhidna lutea]|uniref:Cystathionine beta-lyase n=1 Tax=Ekhidna lutea TaxID=447679 RepID=A0A239HI01_EKHLU|nr:cystathionine gamma-synthase [Ekhidna lutea]SNS80751.1 cystathionine beta-lyase [Ekhidna lutea]